MSLTVDDNDDYDNYDYIDNNISKNLALLFYGNIEISDTEHYDTNNK
jgi:hypothetical protein